MRHGEILGLAGVVGAGRTEVVRAIFGADPIEGGRILREERPVVIHSPRDAVRAGICLVTENRKEEGLVLPMAARVNTTLARLRRVTRAGFVLRDAEREATERMTAELALRLSGPEQPVVQLSGGIVVVSSELPELMHLCDRILVLSRGRLAGEVARADFSEERILSLAYSQFMHTA